MSAASFTVANLFSRQDGWELKKKLLFVVILDVYWSNTALLHD